MAARVGATELTSTNEATSVISPRLVARPDEASRSGRPMAMTEPKADQQDDHGDQDADDLLAAGLLLDRLGGQVAAQLHAHGAGLGVGGRCVASRRSKASSRMPSDGRSYCTST